MDQRLLPALSLEQEKFSTIPLSCLPEVGVILVEELVEKLNSIAFCTKVKVNNLVASLKLV